MAFTVEIETKQGRHTVQSGRGSGDAVFATRPEAEGVAHMFEATLDDCKASVVERGPTSPPS